MTKRIYIREAIDYINEAEGTIDASRFRIQEDADVKMEGEGAWVPVEVWVPKPKLTKENLITELAEELAEIDLDTDEEHALLAEFKRKARVLTGLVVPRKED